MNSHVEQLQHWMKDVITTQGDMQYKLRRAEHLHGLNEHDVIADTMGVSIYSRMHVYTSGYVMRLLECIEADFPVLQQFLGEQVFDQFARASLLWSPSTSYSLYDLGSTFIAFLEGTRPKGMPQDSPEAAFLDLPIEIARAERAQHEALRASGIEGAGIVQVELFPDEILFSNHALTVETPACVRLVPLQFPVKQMFDQYREEQPLSIPHPQPSFLVVSRMNYRLTMEEVEEWLFVFLGQCASLSSLSEAIDRTSAITQLPSSTLLAELCIWLPILQEKGFLVICREG